MSKRIISFLLVICLMCSVHSYAFASHSIENALFEVSSLGIIPVSEIEDWQKDTPVTREEFAEIIIRMVKMSDLKEVLSEDTFSDVSETNKYKASIELAARFGLMSGVGEGLFNPDGELKVNQAAKVIVTALGYSVVAENSGGWPGGYQKMAVKLGLLDGITSSDVISKTELALMIYNALDVNLLKEVFSAGSTTYETVEGETLRSSLLGKTRIETIQELTGVVLATAYSYIVTEEPNLLNDEVIIDGVTYKTGRSDIADFLGQEVDFYAVEREVGMPEIISVRTSKKTTVEKIAGEDFLYFSNEEVIFTDDKEKIDKINISGFRFLYNGVPISFDDVTKISSINGRIDVIENSGVSINCIFIWDYDCVPVSASNNGLVFFKESHLLNGKKFLNIDLEDDDKKFVVLNAAGEVISPDEIKENDVLSIYEDLGETRYTVYVSNDTVIGKITQSDEETFEIEGVEYRKNNGSRLDVNVGDTVILYLDYMGCIAFAEPSDEESQYGYIVAVGKESELSEVNAKIVTAKQVSFDTEEQDNSTDDVENTVEIPVLVCENEAVSIFKFAKNVKINGEKCKNKSVDSILESGMIISFKTNESGEINVVESPVFSGGSTSLRSKYSVYDKVFGGSTLFEGFAIDEKTKLISIPTSDNPTDEDFMVRTVVNVSGNGAGYLVQGYDYDEQTKKCALAVIHKYMDAEEVVSARFGDNKPSIVLKASYFNDDYSESEKLKLVLLKEDGIKEYVINEVKKENEVLATLKKGDMISHVEDSNGNLSNVVLIRSIPKIKRGIISSNAKYGYTEYSGVISDISFNDVQSAEYKLADTVTLDINGELKSVPIQHRNPAPVVYRYSIEQKKAEPATLSEAIPGEDRIHIVLNSANVPVSCVIIGE